MKINVKNTIIIIIFFLLLFQNVLLDYSSIFNYLDEFLSIIFLFYFLFHKKDNPKILKIFSIMLILIIGGLFYNFINGIQPHAMAIIEDVISMFKFLFIFLGMHSYLSNTSLQKERIIQNITPLIKLFIYSLTALAIINIFFDIGMSVEERIGIRGFAFVYDTPGHIINQISYCILILMAEKQYLKKNNYMSILCSLFVMISTLKVRGLILAFLFSGLVYMFAINKKKKHTFEVIIILILSFLIGYSQFEYYFMNVGTPRQMFVSGSVKLVKEYFPFGTGFGTYGSSSAAKYYSPLYYKLGFSTRYGMTPDNQLYLNDNYLPLVFGQFGIMLGFIFIYLVYAFSKFIIKKSEESNSTIVKIITYFFILNLVLSSIQSSYLAHYSVVTFSLIYYFLFYNSVEVSINDN